MSELTQKKERQKRKELEALLDDMWSYIIKARAGFRCELYKINLDRWVAKPLVCNRLIQAAHLVTRTWKASRWNLKNGRSLCGTHHTYFTWREAQWSDICTELWRDDYLSVKSIGVNPQVDREAVFQELSREARTYFKKEPNPKLQQRIELMEGQAKND